MAIAARHILDDRAGLLEALEKSAIDSPDVRATLESVSNLVRRLQNQATPAVSLNEIIDRVELRDDGISIALNIEVPGSRVGVRTSSILNLSRFLPLRLKRRGVETRIIMAAGDDLPSSLTRRCSRRWHVRGCGLRNSPRTEQARLPISHVTRISRYVERLSRLAFTAPKIVEAICQGRQPAELNAETLLNRIDLPLKWSAPLKAIGID